MGLFSASFDPSAVTELILRYAWVALLVGNVFQHLIGWARVQDHIRGDSSLAPGYAKLFVGSFSWFTLLLLGMGVGILTGQVENTFSFLNPPDGNTYVLGYWILALTSGALGVLWVCALGGAELLERHPGAFLLPPLSAGKLKLASVFGFIWNLVIVALLFSGVFPWREGGTELNPDAFVWAFPFLFIGMAFLVTLVLAQAGWAPLAAHYTDAESRSPATRLHFQSGSFGSFGNYNSALVLGASKEGLYLRTFIVFRLNHPPLFVPWNDIEMREDSPSSRRVVLSFEKTPKVFLRLSRKTTERLLTAADHPIEIAAS